jgi:environmental stress-induced protein Ves
LRKSKDLFRNKFPEVAPRNINKIKQIMGFEVIRGRDCKTVEWSAGTTTQLYISPDGANFQSDNYDFRVSVARVIEPESTFTSLPGVERLLMVLEGEQELSFPENSETYRQYE